MIEAVNEQLNSKNVPKRLICLKLIVFDLIISKYIYVFLCIL